MGELIGLLLNQADPIGHRIQFALHDEFVLISTADGIRRLEDFERRCRPPSHDFKNILNRRILTETDPSMFRGDDLDFERFSMHLDNVDIVDGVAAASEKAKTPIKVDWKGLETARQVTGSKISLCFDNPTLIDVLALMFGQVYKLDRLRISCDANTIYVTPLPQPSIQGSAVEPSPRTTPFVH